MFLLLGVYVFILKSLSCFIHYYSALDSEYSLQSRHLYGQAMSASGWIAVPKPSGWCAKTTSELGEWAAISRRSSHCSTNRTSGSAERDRHPYAVSASTRCPNTGERLWWRLGVAFIVAVLSAVPVRRAIAEELNQESCSFPRGEPQGPSINITHSSSWESTEPCIYPSDYVNSEIQRQDHYKGMPFKDLSWTSSSIEYSGAGSALAPSFFAPHSDPQGIRSQPEAGAVRSDQARPLSRAEISTLGPAPVPTEMAIAPAGTANRTATTPENLPFGDLGEPHRVRAISLGPARPPWRVEIQLSDPAPAETEMAATPVGAASRSATTPESQSFDIFGEPLRVRTFAVNMHGSIRPLPTPAAPARSSSLSGPVAQAPVLRGSIRELGEVLSEPELLGKIVSVARPLRAGQPSATVPPWPW